MDTKDNCKMLTFLADITKPKPGEMTNPLIPNPKPKKSKRRDGMRSSECGKTQKNVPKNVGASRFPT